MDRKEEIHFIGRYGESFLFTPLQGGSYIASCPEIGMKDAIVSYDEIGSIYHKYVEVGEKGFDAKDEESLKARAKNLGDELRGHYLFFRGPNLSARFRHGLKIRTILKDAEALGLNHRQYIDWLLSRQTRDREDYMSFMLQARRIVKDSRPS